MSNESCVKIEITKKIPFSGEGDTLENRLRNVTLKGFPDIKIYENASFRTVFLASERIPIYLHTPQPSIYQTHLNRIEQLAKLFHEKGINITDLDAAYDFIATSESGEETEWTMIPPVVERFNIPEGSSGELDYTPLIGPELLEALKEEDLNINPQTLSLKHTAELGDYSLINDGSHRIHYGFQNKGIKIMEISGITSGFPYYAAPQSYSEVQVFANRDKKNTSKKIHIITDPGHKNLYRLFPSGGIKSGEVRPEK